MKDKFATFPKLNVRRCSRIVVGENEDTNNRSNEVTAKSKGAEFILNSSLPCQEIDISDQNVCIAHNFELSPNALENTSFYEQTI